MAVFDKTELLVMMPLCSAFTAAHKTDALAAGNMAKMSLSALGWKERCVVLLSHEYALGWACQVRRLQRSRRQEGHQQTVVEAVCAKVASSCPRKRKLLPYEDKELFTRNSVEWKEWAIPEIHPYSVQDRTECRYSARRERVARQEGAVARRSCVASSPHNQFWGSVIFRVI